MESIFDITRDWDQSQAAPVFGITGNTGNNLVGTRTANNAATNTNNNNNGTTPDAGSMPDYINGGLGRIKGLLGDMIGNPTQYNKDGTINTASSGLGGGLNALNAGMGLFNTWNNYQTAKQNRALGDQQLQSNATAMADKAWNTERLRSAFGMGGA